MAKSSDKQNSLGTVLALFVSKEQVDKLIVDDVGIIDDKFYNQEIERSVLISSVDSYKMAEDKNISLTFGKLGENIVMSCNPYALPAGTQINIGEVQLEITQRCTLCKSLTKIDPKLPKLLKDDRGIFAKVIQAGTIQKDDKIYIV
jgi:MOSC domain-containing protein YiiM